MTPQQIAVLVVVGTLGLLFLLLLLYGRPRRTAQEPLPATFSRGDPDSVLEGQRLNRILVWGFASAVFMTGFLAVYFVIEPFRQVAYSEHFYEVSVNRGERVYFQAAECAACHGAEGEGGFAFTDPTWPAPPLNNAFHRFTRDEFRRIVAMGREGTPMPPWAIEFGGPLNSAMIDDVVNFVEALQVDPDDRYELPEDVTDGAQVFDRKCAVCHGPEGEGRAMGSPFPTFYAPDVSTSFFQLGIPMMRDEISRRLAIELERDPTAEEIEEAFAQATDEEIIELGEEAARATIERGRPNTPMPAWANRIHEHQIDALMDFLRGIQRVPTR